MERKNPIPPYVAYRTFRNFLVQLEKQGLPGRIDRSVLAHKSGTVQSQLLLALEFLGLINQSGKPADDLKRLLTGAQKERMADFKDILERSYPFVFGAGFDVKSATSDQAEEVFRRTGASGETVRRCLSFFLAAARDAGIPVSPYIKPHRGKKSRASDTSSDETAVPASSPPRAASTGPVTRTVRLRGGGRLTLQLDVDLFRLPEQDRRFVFRLIDQIQAFEEGEE